MLDIPTWVLPGLDGTTSMLRSFRDAAPPSYHVTLVDLPPDGADYATIYSQLGKQFDAARECILIAESFSGPLAIKLAAEHHHSIRCLILVATFARPPVGAWIRYLPLATMLRFPIPSFIARYYLLGFSADPATVQLLRSVIRRAKSRILAGRIRETTRIDVQQELKQLSCPVLYLHPTADKLIKEHSVNAIRQLRPDLEICRIEGSHMILETQPARVWKAIEEFTRSSMLG